MQIVEVKVPFNETYNFFCPVTGQQILSPEDYQPSPALCGCWVDLAPEDPMDVRADLKTAWTEFCEQDDDNCYEVRKFLESIESDNLVAFQIETSGMACGPVHNTSWIVIDMTWSEGER